MELPPYALTDTQIRNAKPCQRPVKANRKDKKSPPLKDGNTKGKTAGDRIQATKGDPKFIATEKPYKRRQLRRILHAAGGNRNAEEILRAVDTGRGSGAGFIIPSLANEHPAKVYARVLMEVAEILPAALEKAQRSRIERRIKALVQVA